MLRFSSLEVQARLEAALDACGAQGVGWGECGLDFNKRQPCLVLLRVPGAGSGIHSEHHRLPRLQRAFALLVAFARADELEAAPELRQQMRQAVVAKQSPQSPEAVRHGKVKGFCKHLQQMRFE